MSMAVMSNKENHLVRNCDSNEKGAKRRDFCPFPIYETQGQSTQIYGVDIRVAIEQGRYLALDAADCAFCFHARWPT